MLAELLCHPHSGEDLRGQRGARTGHHGVRVGDDEGLVAGAAGGERLEHGLASIPHIDIAPEVPLAKHRVGVECRKVTVLAAVHHVREAQTGHAQFGIPAAELKCHRLFEMLDQRVRRVRLGRVLLVDRKVGRRHVERQAEHSLARGVDDALDPGLSGALEDVEADEHVVAEGSDVAHQPGGRDGSKMDDGIQLLEALLDAAQRVDHLTGVSEVDLDKADRAGRASGRGSAVQIDDVIAGVLQPGDHTSAEFAASSGHGNSHRPLPPLVSSTIAAPSFSGVFARSARVRPAGADKFADSSGEMTGNSGETGVQLAGLMR